MAQTGELQILPSIVCKGSFLLSAKKPELHPLKEIPSPQLGTEGPKSQYFGPKAPLSPP